MGPLIYIFLLGPLIYIKLEWGHQGQPICLIQQPCFPLKNLFWLKTKHKQNQLSFLLSGLSHTPLCVKVPKALMFSERSGYALCFLWIFVESSRSSLSLELFPILYSLFLFDLAFQLHMLCSLCPMIYYSVFVCSFFSLLFILESFCPSSISLTLLCSI